MTNQFLINAALFATAALSAYALSYIVRRYAIAKDILDHPNDRSSHTRPVPRGGGIAIVFTFVVLCTALAMWGTLPANIAIALIGGGSLVSFVGWLDDRSGGISAVWRFIVHVIAAIWAIGWLGPLESLHLGSGQLNLGPLLGTIVAIICIVWSINLFNFMDGIDGIAAAEALTVGLAAALVSGTLFGFDGVSLLAISAAGCAAGFLFWNWSPAKLFMGDVGSGFLGFVFAALAITSELDGKLPFAGWMLLAGAFLTDSTVTLLRRMMRGERWYSAHRSHAYQRLAAFGYSHRRVTLAVIVLNYILATLTFFAFSGQGRLAFAVAGALVLLSCAYLLVEKVNPMNTAAQPSPKTGTSR